MLNKEIGATLKDHPGDHAIQAVPGVGPVLAAVFAAEIGDVSRFATAPRLCSWAGVTPARQGSAGNFRTRPISGSPCR